MRSVAIVGFAQSSLGYAKESTADEMWSVNFAWDYAVPRIDRLFEIHPLWYLALQKGERDKKHLGWMQNKWFGLLRREHPFPIYTYADYTKKRTMGEIELEPYLSELEKRGINPKSFLQELYQKNKVFKQKFSIPSSVPYPFEEVYSLFDNLRRGADRRRSIYLTSTISYMIALAILEKFDVIELYGIELSVGSEYVYQKAGAEMLLGYAAAKGIEVRLVEQSKLLNSSLYHEGAQMINRQACEQHAQLYKDGMHKYMGERNLLAGQLNDLRARNAPMAEIQEMAERVQDANNNIFFNQGAMQAMENAIKHIDMDNPIIELINQINFNEVTTTESPVKKKRVRNRSKKS